MKVRISKNIRTKETRIDYFKVDDKKTFRFSLLKRILENIDLNVTLVVDTNQFIRDIANNDVKRILTEAKVIYTSFPIPENSTLFLGIKTDFIKRQKTKNQELFLLEIDSESFGQKLFDELFQYGDLAFGISRKKTAQEISDIFKTLSSDRALFNKDFFEHSIYDSIVCTSLRSSIDIQDYVKELAI